MAKKDVILGVELACSDFSCFLRGDGGVVGYRQVGDDNRHSVTEPTLSLFFRVVVVIWVGGDGKWKRSEVSKRAAFRPKKVRRVPCSARYVKNSLGSERSRLALFSLSLRRPVGEVRQRGERRRTQRT